MNDVVIEIEELKKEIAELKQIIQTLVNLV